MPLLPECGTASEFLTVILPYAGLFCKRVLVYVPTKVSWANRVWALPFLTTLAPSERYYDDKPRTHKKLTDWAINLLKALQGQVSLISRLQLDAALYEPVPLVAKGQRGRKRLKGPRVPTLLRIAEAWVSIP